MAADSFTVVTHVVAFVAGLVVLLAVLDSALRTFVLPRGSVSFVTRLVFVTLRRVFDAVARSGDTYEWRDRVMALYAPIGLLLLPIVWLVLVMLAYAGIFYALGVGDGLRGVVEVSGSSLFTLGFLKPPDLTTILVAFTEAAVGVGLVALLVSYLPTIYSAFSRREVLVAQLATRAGDPPWGANVLLRAHEMGRFHLLEVQWIAWQLWFAEVEETHTSLGVLALLRSPRATRSWVTAAGAVLDAASLQLAAVDVPYDPEAGMCVRSGFLSLRAVASYYGIESDPDPAPDDPISIDKLEFFDALDHLARGGVQIKADREQAWRDFNGWRVNYDVPLLGLAALVMAPYAPWSSDRSLRRVPRSPLRRPSTATWRDRNAG